jgi:hypothetical protein
MPRRLAAGAALLFVLGLLPRVLGLPLWGTFDVEIQKAWAWRAAEGGIADIYGPSDARLRELARADGQTLVDWLRSTPFPQHVFEWKGASYFVDYPPGSVLVLWAEGTLYRALAPEMPNRRPFNAAVNLGAFLGSLVVAVLLYRSSPAQGTARAAHFWLNPAMILAVPVLGYQDTIFGALALGALLALGGARYGMAGALTVAAGLVKPQGALLVPIVALTLARRGTVRDAARCALAGAAAASAVLAPWWSSGHLLSAIDGCLRPLRQPTLAPLGLNVWWIAGYVMAWSRRGPWPLATIATIADFEAWSGIDPRLCGRLALLAASAAILAWLWRRGASRPALAVALVLQVHAYALLSTSVHENHTFLAVLAAALVVGDVPDASRAVLLTSLFLFAAVFLMGGGLGRRVMTLHQLEELRGAFRLDLSVVAAAAHVVLAAWLVRWATSVLRSTA